MLGRPKACLPPACLLHIRHLPLAGRFALRRVVHLHVVEVRLVRGGCRLSAKSWCAQGPQGTEAVEATVGQERRCWWEGGASLGVAAAVRTAAVNEATLITAAEELVPAESEEPIDSRIACSNSDWKRASSLAGSDAGRARTED